MCGIVGIFCSDGINADKRVIERMSKSLAHRGPDEEGFHIDRRVHLASRRLTIIDLHTGSQPLYNHDGSLCIVYNGEVYNYKALRAELASLGYSLRTQSDTEAILYAYCEWGSRCLDRLNGMFAFCIWNANTGELFLARDRFGIKPLYYTRLADGTFLFASEIKALLAHPHVPRRVHENAIDNLLTFGFNVAPYTFFENIKQLLPGFFMKVRSNGATLTQYWDIELDAPMLDIGVNELTSQFQSRLEKSVRAGVVSDVPVAAYLSGGIDSTTIAGLYSRIADRKIKTITITFENAGYDEREFSRKGGEFFQTDYSEFPCAITPDEIVKLAYHLENPIVSLLSLPFFLLSKKAREMGVKVVLSGDGSDEIIGGYDYFRILKAMAFIGNTGSEWRKTALRRIFPRLETFNQVDSMYYVLRIAADRFPAAHPAVPYRYQSFQHKQKLYSPEFAERMRKTPPDEPFFFDLEKIAHRSLMDQALYIETKMRLLNLTLPLADKMSMANSVEARPLFLDHEFVNFLFRVPPHLKMLGLSEKHILKKSMTGIAPDEICRRKKQPFQPPAGWFIDAAGDLLRDLLAPPKVKETGFFNADFISFMLSEYDRKTPADYSGLIITAFFMQLWHETFFGKGL